MFLTLLSARSLRTTVAGDGPPSRYSASQRRYMASASPSDSPFVRNLASVSSRSCSTLAVITAIPSAMTSSSVTSLCCPSSPLTYQSPAPARSTRVRQAGSRISRRRIASRGRGVGGVLILFDSDSDSDSEWHCVGNARALLAHCVGIACAVRAHGSGRL